MCYRNNRISTSVTCLRQVYSLAGFLLLHHDIRESGFTKQTQACLQSSPPSSMCTNTLVERVASGEVILLNYFYLIETFSELWGVTLNKQKAQVVQLALRDLTCRCTNGWSHNGQPAAVLMVSRSFILLLPPAVLLCCEINSHMIKSASVSFPILSRLNNGFIKTACILGCAGNFSLGFCKLLIHDYVVRWCGFGLRFHCQSSYTTRCFEATL